MKEVEEDERGTGRDARRGGAVHGAARSATDGAADGAVTRPQ